MMDAEGLIDPIETVEEAARLIREAERVVYLTGAGISTESGIPDFRGPQGVWTKNPEAERTATIQHYLSSSEVRARSWQNRLKGGLTRGVEPNAGHIALATLERIGKVDTLVTQNVDGLHQAAGSSPERIIEIHGTVHDYVCLSCGDRGPIGAVLARVDAGEADPPCRKCGGILKTATISFGQNLVREDLLRAEVAAEMCDLFVAVGTSLTVYPVAMLPEIAIRNRAKFIIVNAQETPYDPLANVILRSRIGAVLPEIVTRV